ncbi:olfactory receptor 12D1-like [Ambystoma mexicanum]|uniref:olfactory receptor 12D1-like n=1 Tax=Ambystoma mexicanum TaxID=8296 RepID=UPI0037E8FEA8
MVNLNELWKVLRYTRIPNDLLNCLIALNNDAVVLAIAKAEFFRLLTTSECTYADLDVVMNVGESSSKNGFVFAFTFYLINITANSVIMTVVITEPNLHTPMYYLLANLSLLDFCFSSVTVPKMLSDFMVEKNMISFGGCIAQLHFIHFLGCTEAMLLMSTSMDRYVAICHPLRYVTVMNDSACIWLTSTSWSVGFLYSFSHTILTARLPFCASNRDSHFFCDIKPLLKLACTNTFINEILVTVITGLLAVGTLFMILVSYVYIGSHLMKIKSSESRQKAFSTCASHLTVVLFYYGTAICIYLRPSTKDSMDQDRMTAILFTVVTPTLNPIIYALRNKEVKQSMKKLIYGPVKKKPTSPIESDEITLLKEHEKLSKKEISKWWEEHSLQNYIDIILMSKEFREV